MATAAKAKTTASPAGKAGSVKKTAAKASSPAKAPVKTATKPAVAAKKPAATAKKPVAAAKKPAVAVKKPVVAAKETAAAKANVVKPVKDTFTKTALVAHLVQESGVESKAVKAVLAALDNAIMGSVMKKGAGEFMLSGMFKVTVQDIPARKARKGIDPFTKEERMFAAKPASRRVKIRALKKLKDSAA